MAILKTLFLWVLEWALGLVQKYWAEKKQEEKEEKAVDKKVDKSLSPDLKEQLDGIEDLEDHINSNS